jgi:RNA polymerase sigma factor (sigma-70 family)
MAHQSPSPDPQALLHHVAWVRRLAGLLVGGTLADDVAQETLLAGVASPPAEGAELRGWLGTVARRVASRMRLREQRRRLREEAAARREALPPTDELVARAEVERSLVDAVLSLDEPWKTSVLLRWFEGRPPRAIARAMGVPVETVRSRLKRALELLRERLIAKRGATDDTKSRRELALLLFDVSRGAGGVGGAGGAAGGAVASVGAWVGAITMTTTVKFALAAGVLLAAGAGWWMQSRNVLPAEPKRVVAGVTDDEESVDPVEPPLVVPARVALAPDEPTSSLSPVPAPSPDELHITGVVLDAAGQPVADAIVFAEPATKVRFLADDFDLIGSAPSFTKQRRLHDPSMPPRTLTDDAGRFEMPAPDASRFHVAAIHEEEGVALRKDVVATPPATEVELRFEPGVVLTGRVTGPDGAPIAGANFMVLASVAANWKGRGGSLLDLRSDADGRFRSMPLPHWHFRIGAYADGFVGNTYRDVSPAPSELLVEVDFRLERSSDIIGRLLDQAGAPFDGSTVSCELHIVGCRRDPRGLEDPEAEWVYGGAIEKGGRFKVDRSAAEFAWIALFAGDRPLAAAPIGNGKEPIDLVVDVDAIRALVPKGTFAVRIVDEASGAWPAEALLSATAQNWSLASGAHSGRREWRFYAAGDGCEVEDARWAPGRGKKPMALDADGAVVLGDLPAGRYWVQASSAGRAAANGEVVVLPAAEGVSKVIELHLATAIGAVRGRVVTSDGVPVRRAAVHAIALSGARLAPDDGDLTTDDDGRFELTGVPPGELFVVAVPPPPEPGLASLVPFASAATRALVGADGTTSEVEVKLPRAVRISVVPHVVGLESSGPWSFRILDAQGARVRDDTDRVRWCEGFAEAFELLVPPGSVTIELLSRKTGRVAVEIVAERNTTLPIDAPPLR